MTKKLASLFSFKKRFSIILILIATMSCKRETWYPIYIDGDGVVDAEGNSYKTVVIGSQEWMAENLKTKLYCNNDSIAFNSGDKDWLIYNNNPQNDSIYGKLYNYQAVKNSSGLCPCGWHVPTTNEFAMLVNYLGGFFEASRKLMSKGTLEDIDGLWKKSTQNSYSGGTNTSGFEAVPGGEATVNEDFWFKDSLAVFWVISLTENYDEAYIIHYDGNYVGKRTFNNSTFQKSSENWYFSIRCLRDY